MAKKVNTYIDFLLRVCYDIFKNAPTRAEHTDEKQLLHENWSFTNEKTGTLSATVPGCVHTDLQGYVTLRADAYLHAVEFEGEYLFEDSYFSMLRGEVRTVHYERLPVTREEELHISAYTVQW